MTQKKKYRQGHYTPINPEKYVGNKNTIFYRSSWEKRVMFEFDTNPAFKKWSSEELKIPYVLDGNPHTYYPDFLVQFENKNGVVQTWLVEVKPKRQTTPPTSGRGKKRATLLAEATTYNKNLAKWNAAEAWCKRKGWEFKILTEDDIFKR